MDRDAARDDEDETTATPSAPEAPPATAPEPADVVRLYLRDASAHAFSCAAGSADVTDGAIEVPRADAARWLAATDELRAEA